MLNFLEDFKPVTNKEWEEQILKELKGQPIEKVIYKTLEEFELNPFYTMSDVESLPYYKSYKIPKFRAINNKINNNWCISDHVPLEKFTSFVEDSISNDVNAFFISINKNSLPFLNIDYLTEVFKISSDNNCTLIFDSSNQTLFLIQLIKNIIIKDKEKNKLNDLSLYFNFSPFDDLIFEGKDLNCSESFLNEFFNKIFDDVFNEKTKIFGINTYKLHNCGINASLEISLALSQFVDLLHILTEKNINVKIILNSIVFNLGVGTNFLMEIAKLRAFRYLINKIVESYNSLDSFDLKIHCINTLWNKSILDSYTNILRTTVEAIAAVFGGVDFLTLHPYDILYKPPNLFSVQLSRNIQLILKEEAKFNRILDPLGGSYYLEILTNKLIDSAWKMFLMFEENGGFINAFKKGIIQQKIAEIQNKRLENLIYRKEIYVGVNNYPNLNEKIKELTNEDVYNNYVFEEIPKLNGNFEIIKPFRAPQQLELLRLNVESLPKKPTFYLLKYGDLVMRNARANFSINFLGCAGFEIIEGNSFNNLNECINEAKSYNPDFVVICSSDEEYTNIVPIISQELSNNYTLILAGFPKDQIEVFKNLKVKFFIHLKANLLETLNEILNDYLKKINKK